MKKMLSLIWWGYTRDIIKSCCLRQSFYSKFSELINDIIKVQQLYQRSEIIINHSTCIIIFKEPMQSFKGLLPRQVLTDDAFLPIHKKAEDHRKAAQVCLDFFHQINKFFQGFSAAVEKCVKQCDIDNVKAPYYSLIGFVCTKIVFENQQLTQNTKGSSKQLTKVCNVILEDYAKFINNFQGDLRKYQQSEAIMQQICKKYFRSHKNMISSIQAYKSTLTDVTLIYNTEQKIKRFQTCQANYKIVLTDFSSVTQKCEALSQRKLKIVQQYQGLKKQYTKVIKLIGSKMIGEAKNFFSYYCSTNKNIVAFLAEQKYNLEKEKLRPFFADIEDLSNRQMFKQEINEKKGKSTVPLIFEFYDLIKDQFLESYNLEMVNYLKRVEENIEKRKVDNKKVLDLFIQYVKVIEKVHIVGVKQIMQKFEKLKIRLKQTFGARLVSFMKSINSILQLLSGSNQKLVKDINLELGSLQTNINEENKMLTLFYEEMKGKIQKFIGKKELKKLKEDEFTEQSSVRNILSFRKEIAQKADYFKHLIKGFQDKMSKTCDKICNGYTNLISTLGQTINKFYSYCCQYQQLYFGPEQFKRNFQMYQKDCQALLQKNIVFFDELTFNILKGDNQKIVFDGQFAKIQEFKKLKKPAIQENIPKQGQKTVKTQVKETKEESGSQSPKPLNEGELEQKEKVEGSAAKSEKQLNNEEDIVRKNSFSKDLSSIEQKQIKNYQFLITKVQMKESQQYLKSYSCALSEKIVLQGRIYITSERICFYSGFNSSIAFFSRGTFIQFPKEDILKVEKRMNAIFLDNSISFTTKKGELNFTSFFSRNEAYDLICRTFDLSLDDHVYETIETEVNEQAQISNVQVKQQDDLQEGQIPIRQNKINQLLSTFAYNEAVKIEISKDNLNAFQIFKTCYSNNEVSINRRKYVNFLSYIKEIISHKDLEVDQWNPSLEQILNKGNIKSTAPLKSTRKIRVTVPVANSGVPFMPKTAKSEQIQTLYFYSKNKWIIEAQINTTGAPYTDTFKVQLRTSASSNTQGKCVISIGYFVNFVKNTMMKSVIESKSQQETVKASKTWLDQIKKYFNNLSKAEASSQKQVKQPGVQQIKEQLEAKTTQLQNIKKQKQELEQRVRNLKASDEKLKKIIFGLSILCFMLLVLAIS